MAAWTDGYWRTADGLRLHFRDYPGEPSRPPIVCIPGLTRNARDFEGVADRLAGDWRLICVELRGRGGSGHAEDAASYTPLVYVEDLEALISALRLERFVLFGTSLGGMLTMLLAKRDNKRIAAALLNDIGPVLERRGIEKILGYVGHPRRWPNWDEAARFIADVQRDRYPDWSEAQWIAYARRLCRADEQGGIAFDYDMRISEPFRKPGGAAGFDLWAAFRGLDGVPSLLLRGELSDLLSAETAALMVAENPAMECVTVPRVGHAPTLDEPESQAAIGRLLARVES